MKEGGDNEDVPIIMGITVNVLGSPIPLCGYVFVNGTDTIAGQTSQTGNYTVQLTKSGQWGMTLSKADYVVVSRILDILDSFTYITDTLQAIP